MIYLFSLIILLVIVISLSKSIKKSRYKGLSAEEMGTAHKNKKSRRERKRK